MAKIESILGKITGTVGDLTFRHQIGTRSTISAKANKVSNPKSIAQNAQRMKIRPAQLFYSAFESVLNHSREGVKIGEDHRRAFLAETMKQSFNGCPYVVKGTTVMVPGLFPMSKGNLRSYDVTRWMEHSEGLGFVMNIKCADIDPSSTVAELTQELVTKNTDLNVGDELCFVAAIADHSGEFFYPIIQYVVLDANDGRNLTDLGIELHDDRTQSGQYLRILIEANDENDMIAGGCVIVSRKVGKKWKYSTTDMELTEEWRDELFSTARYQAAIASYGEGGVNAVNSPFILQQSTNQPFNGRVAAFNKEAGLGPDGEKELVPIRFVAAIRANISNVYETSAIIAVFVHKTSGALIGYDGKEISKTIDGMVYKAKPADIGWTGQTIEWNDIYLSQVEN